MVPDADLLFSGDYMRQGVDLWISQDGQLGAVIEGYFLTENPAPLTSPSGAQLSGSVVEALTGGRAPGQIAQAGTPSAAEPIGQVETLTGEAQATRTDGSVVALSLGTPVYQGDVVETRDGSLGLSFLDGTVFSLSENARMVLDELVYEPGGSSNSMLFNLVEGGFVFVAGQIAPTGDMKVATPVATLGVRGTSPTVFIARSGEVIFSIVKDPGPDGKVGSYLLFDAFDRVIGEINDVGRKLILASSTAAAIIVDKTATDLEEERLFVDQAYKTYETMRSRSGPAQNPDAGGQGPDDGGEGPPDGEFRDGSFSPEGVFRAGLEGGRPGDELIIGREAGENFLSGGRGDDILFGGITSDDVLKGGQGDDLIIGGVFGLAIISGGPGDDILIGSEFGPSIISGGPGDDTIIGNVADDLLSGGTGDDEISGGGGDDIISGDEGADELDGEEGSDFISGGTGNDLLLGGDDDDLLVGGPGDDDLFGNGGSDILTGGLGADRFGFLAADESLDVVVDFGAGDFLDIDDLLAPSYTTATAAAFVSAVEVSGSTVLSVDGDGTGTALGFEVVAVLTGVTAGTALDYTIDGFDTLDTVVVS